MSVARAPKLSVIIVTWNVRELVLACLAAFEREAAAVDAEIIVVDNASIDDTATAVGRAYPHVRVIANAQNVGFPVANNQALTVARGEYVLFLNPDTEVGPGAVQACVTELDADATIGMIGCKLVLEDGRTQLECARRLYLLRHLLLELLYLHMLFPRNRVCGDHLMSHWDHTGERDVEAISGAFMMTRRSLAIELGGLPPEIFMYHEDLAFCLRVRRAGWRIRYNGSYQTLHRWRGSSRSSNAPLALLEGQVKLDLIREAQGSVAAGLARVVFAIRCVLRLLAGGFAALAFSWTRLPARYPAVFAWRTHGLQLIWAVAPVLIRRRMPRPPDASMIASIHTAVVGQGQP